MTPRQATHLFIYTKIVAFKPKQDIFHSKKKKRCLPNFSKIGMTLHFVMGNRFYNVASNQIVSR